MENIPKIQSNGVPFNGELVGSSVFAVFSEIENNPNKVIRAESFDELNERYNSFPCGLCRRVLVGTRFPAVSAAGSL